MRGRSSTHGRLTLAARRSLAHSPSPSESALVFRRKNESPSPTTTSATSTKEGGKGRPTPSRREAEAAARARAKAPRDKKEATKAQRAFKSEQSQRIRAAMKSGDERYLPARDKGPVRRFVRDYVDARLCLAELLLPMLLIIILTGGINPSLSASIQSATLVLVALDTGLLIFRLRRELRRRFPDEITKGAVGYAVLRSLQIRWLRMPKAQKKLGAKLPERYGERAR